MYRLLGCLLSIQFKAGQFMRKTSFGHMEILRKQGSKPQVEYLEFEVQGRPHKHAEFETFVVLEGTGQIMSGDTTFRVQPGDMVEIPPHTDHWMVPAPGKVLKGLLWYSDCEGAFHRHSAKSVSKP
jgi:mannose-6-phosphate isomerase-like protein (cupin superfamily)